MQPVFILGILTVQFLACCHAERWLHSTVLDKAGRYWVYWTKDGDDIDFKVEVQAKGYVGFGLSRTGAMAGSDIVTGWVVDGEVHFQDRHARGNYMPEVDSSQDWELVSGRENETHTILHFRRKLRTCDKEHDLEIDQSTTRLIYAFSDRDPPSQDKLQYHSQNRGARSVMLLQPELNTQMSTEGLSVWDVRSPNYSLSSDTDTMYWCKVIRGPRLSKKHHIVKIEPLIQPGNEPYVHHIVMYECVGGDAAKLDALSDQYGHQCYHPNMPDEMRNCEGVFAAWGVGGEVLVFPEKVGLPIFPSPPLRYYLLELHYDNPALHEVTDQSGLRMYYTSETREFDAGTLMIGSAVMPRMVIPPGQESFVSVGHSHPDCLGPAMPPEGIKVLGVFLHSHLLGRKIKARHFRGQEELPPLSDNSNYDFNYQEYSYLPEEVTFLPGDQMTVECTYDSSDRQGPTFGGLSTTQEMCLAFALYYPRIERFASLSIPSTSLVLGLLGIDESYVRIGSIEDFVEMMFRTDWSKVNISNFQSAMMYSPHSPYCYLGDGDKTSVQETISYPVGLKPYKEMDTCSPHGTASSMKSGAPHTRAYSSVLAALCITYLTITM